MNDFSYLIEYLRIGRRQEDAAKRELRFEVIIVNENYNIEAMESTQYILKTDFDNPALITPLADVLEGQEELFFTNDAGTLTYYIRREAANNTYEYRNILSGGWITLSDQTLYSVPVPFSKELYFYSEVYRSVILKQLDEILPITDWFIYHPNDIPMINDGEYGFDYKDDHGNTKNDPLKLIFLQFISATVSAYKRNVTVGKSPFSNKTYLFPIVSKMSNRYILKYHIKTDDPLETLRFQEIWSIRLEFTYLGSCLEFLNQTIMHDYDGLNWETKPRKAFLDSYKTIVNNALTAANFGSIENVLEILYYLPKAFIKEIDKNLLWNFLDRSLEGLVTNIGLDKEDLVLVLLEALSEVERTPTIFLSELIQPKSGGESRFLLLYRKINGENFKQTIQLLYKFWLKSAFSDIDNPVFKNSDGPLFLPYKSDKFLGFYNSNKNFEFQKDNTILVTPDDHYIDEIISVANPAFRNVISDVIEDQIEYHYHPFQPVYLTETEQEAEIDLPKIVPAFFIKANEDKTFWANVITGIEYSLDILTILSGIGNITKFRYLYRLGQATGAMGTFRLAAGAIEISSGAVSAMVKLSGTKNEFALALQKHLLYLELVALSGEISIAIRNRLKSSAREVLEKHLDELKELKSAAKNADEAKEIDEIIEHLERMSEKARNAGKFNINNEGEISIKAFNKIAKRIKDQFGIEMYLIDRHNEKWAALFKAWQNKSLDGFFTATKHPSKNYPGILLDGPALYLFKGAAVDKYYTITSYTVQHELFHLKMFNRIRELFPNNYIDIFYKVPDEIHETFVLSEFVRAKKYTKWSETDILNDLKAFNQNFTKTKRLDDFKNFNLDHYLKSM